MKTINQPTVVKKPYHKLLPVLVVGVSILMANTANAALDLSTALDGADLKANIETGILFALGVVLVIWGGRKVIGFFGR